MSIELDGSGLPWWAFAFFILIEIIVVIPHIGASFKAIAGLQKRAQSSKQRIIVQQSKIASSPKKRPVPVLVLVLMLGACIQNLFFAYEIVTAKYPVDDRPLVVGLLLVVALYMGVAFFFSLKYNRSLRW